MIAERGLEFIDEARRRRPPVLPRAVGLHAAPAGRPRPAPPRAVPRREGAARARLQPRGRATPRAWLGRAARAPAGAAGPDRLPLPQPRALRRRHRRDARHGCASASTATGQPGQHLRHLQLRQRLPHGRAPAAARQADRLRPRHPRPARSSPARACPPGAASTRSTQNTDLAPTFEELAGALPRADVDGRSLAGLMHGAGAARRLARGRARRAPPHRAQRQRPGRADARPAATRRPTRRCAPPRPPTSSTGPASASSTTCARTRPADATPTATLTGAQRRRLRVLLARSSLRRGGSVRDSTCLRGEQLELSSGTGAGSAALTVDAQRRRPAAQGVDDRAQRGQRGDRRLPAVGDDDQPDGPAVEVGPRVRRAAPRSSRSRS